MQRQRPRTLPFFVIDRLSFAVVSAELQDGFLQDGVAGGENMRFRQRRFYSERKVWPIETPTRSTLSEWNWKLSGM